MTDIRVENHLSILLLVPESDAGQEWLDEHIPEDALHWGTAIVVEPRYVADIIHGALEDGLEVL